jgi:hypothetical protein
LRREHWFELELAAGATVVRHTIEGGAAGKYEAGPRPGPGHGGAGEPALGVPGAVGPRKSFIGLAHDGIADVEADFIRRFIPCRHPASQEPASDLEPVSGIEPLTCRLQDGCSAN